MKLLITGGAGFLEYGVTLGFEKIPRVTQHSQNGGINQMLVDKSK
ncbi:MAG: hypothetical protein Q7S45_03935 [Candidatus Curtissbacteria bacterium]|nr:hypothetical protein [Candidatus Curtissbacteria bacterium]